MIYNMINTMKHIITHRKALIHYHHTMKHNLTNTNILIDYTPSYYTTHPIKHKHTVRLHTIIL